MSRYDEAFFSRVQAFFSRVQALQKAPLEKSKIDIKGKRLSLLLAALEKIKERHDEGYSEDEDWLTAKDALTNDIFLRLQEEENDR